MRPAATNCYLVTAGISSKPDIGLKRALIHGRGAIFQSSPLA